jgi:hypothetical protein
VIRKALLFLIPVTLGLPLTGLGDVFCVHASVASAAASGGGSRPQRAARPAPRAAGPGMAAALATGTR